MIKMKKNILVVDDSALMRRVICDIIQSDERFSVEDIARDGQQAYELLKVKKYDAVVADINMPRMTGLELLERLQKEGIKVKVIIASTLTKDGAKETMRALELGAFDFVTKPGNFIEAKGPDFKEELLRTVKAAFASSNTPARPAATAGIKPKSLMPGEPKPVTLQKTGGKSGKKIVAVACSTGGPKSLQSVLPFLPGNLDAPVVLVQHMPAGFTATLASRLNDLSKIRVKEAEDGEELVNGCVYIAPGGKHLACVKTSGGHKIAILDDPPRNALRPCADIMYESLLDCKFDEIVCVVLTGMGADGTAGIERLSKAGKKMHVIAQDEASSVVYGMPRSITEKGLVDKVAALNAVAEEITRNVGCTGWM